MALNIISHGHNFDQGDIERIKDLVNSNVPSGSYRLNLISNSVKNPKETIKITGLPPQEEQGIFYDLEENGYDVRPSAG